MSNHNLNTNGLSSEEAMKLQKQYGKNELTPQKKQSFIAKVFHIISEPMFLLLIIAAIIYFILGEPCDGAIMLIFVIGIITIDVIQEWKTDKTLTALKDLSAPHIKVIRDGKPSLILSSNLVPGDIMEIYEGVKIPADGFIIKCNDLCIDESSLTGESEGVWKTVYKENQNDNNYWKKDYCYAGTLTTQGSGLVLVDKIGYHTEYGKIGKNITSAPENISPIQKQTGKLVKICALIAVLFFSLVLIFTYFNLSYLPLKDRLTESILSGITLAMAMIPEEFPVILTVFLSMGAWRLAKKNSLVKSLPCVETLGSVSVLCVDKTGTITTNQMVVNNVWSIDNNSKKLSEIMGLACETTTYDPMEKAMLSYCESLGLSKDLLFSGELLTEYPFTNELKMMGHVWARNDKIILAAKGSPERILTLCDIDDDAKNKIQNKIDKMSSEGLRVIAVAYMDILSKQDIPNNLTEAKLKFSGIISLLDPPRQTVKNDIKICNQAGIRVVMITGDNGITASSIAKKVGMKNIDNIITGDMINNMTDNELRQKVKDVNIFSRVIPEHKMRIVKAFQENGEIVAMTGDGVNDAPALKHADIGIAMGKRGSDVSREAADLILMDDNFTTIIETVKDGRRIYDNIRKAIGYIFTIHIPIAFSSLIAPILGIPSSSLLLLPLHVVLLELIIDPTCSIVLERQPAENNIMKRQPRSPKENILNYKTLIKSISQGLFIFASSFILYFTTLNQNPDNAPIARSMGLCVIIIANLFLVQVNSSNIDSIFKSASLLIKDKLMWAVNIITFLSLFIILYTPLNKFLKLAPLSLSQICLSFSIGALCVLWYEIIKLIIRLKNNSKNL